MNKLLSILLVSFMFSGNLEVEGGITATGEVQSPTIQALLNQIAQLQDQIALLQAQLNSQNGLTSRIISFNISQSGSGDGVAIPISEVIGYDLERGSIKFVGLDGELEDFFQIKYVSVNPDTGLFIDIGQFYISPYTSATSLDNAGSFYFDSFVNTMHFDYQANSSMFFDGVLYFLVTAEFPN